LTHKSIVTVSPGFLMAMKKNLTHIAMIKKFTGQKTGHNALKDLKNPIFLLLLNPSGPIMISLKSMREFSLILIILRVK